MGGALPLFAGITDDDSSFFFLSNFFFSFLIASNMEFLGIVGERCFFCASKPNQPPPLLTFIFCLLSQLILFERRLPFCLLPTTLFCEMSNINVSSRPPYRGGERMYVFSKDLLYVCMCILVPLSIDDERGGGENMR